MVLYMHMFGRRFKDTKDVYLMEGIKEKNQNGQKYLNSVMEKYYDVRTSFSSV